MAWREHDRLVIRLKLLRKYRSGLSPAGDVGHACWEAIRPTGVDFPHAWAAQFKMPRPAATDVMGHRKNAKDASYVLINFYGFFFVFFRVWPTDLIARFLLKV